MVTMSAANTTALKNFDFDGFVLGFKAPEFKVPLFKRADLIPVINELEDKLDELDKKAEEQRGKRLTMSEKSVDGELRKLTEKYNATVAEYEASKVVFLFRPFTSGELKVWVNRTKALNDSDETDLPIYAEGMALTCISHPLTFEQWMTLCDAVGAFAFGVFGRTWNQTLATGGSADAPFSRRPSPTQTTETPSGS